MLIWLIQTPEQLSPHVSPTVDKGHGKAGQGCGEAVRQEGVNIVLGEVSWQMQLHLGSQIRLHIHQKHVHL